MSQLTVHDLVKEIVSYQQVGPPYQGWDLDKIKALVSNVQIADQKIGDPHDEDLTLLREFFSVVRNTAEELTGINITAINKVAAKMRKHLGLPSVEELDADIANMREAARASVESGTGPLADLAKRYNEENK